MTLVSALAIGGLLFASAGSMAVQAQEPTPTSVTEEEDDEEDTDEMTPGTTPETSPDATATPVEAAGVQPPPTGSAGLAGSGNSTPYALLAGLLIAGLAGGAALYQWRRV